MAKKSKRARREHEEKRLETQYFSNEPWIATWVGVVTTPPLSEAHRRLSQLLSGPEPIEGVPSRPPPLDEEDLFMDFVAYLEIQVIPQVMEGLDSLLLAIYAYAKKHHVDLVPLFATWIEIELLAPAYDLRYPGEEVDKDHIATCLVIARMFALELGYFSDGWTNLRQGLGLRFGDKWVSPSTLIGSCAQLLGGGHRIRKWCAGAGLAGKPDWFEGWGDKPSGRQDFHEILSAVERQYERTEDEWAKAVLLATKEHFEFGFRDLTSGEVYHIIFERTRPSVFAAPGDEAPQGVDGGGDGDGHLPNEAIAQ